MSRNEEPDFTPTLADFGIELGDPTFCPKCRTSGLVLAPDQLSWHCDFCHWSWSLARQLGRRMIYDAAEISPELLRWHEKGMPTGVSLGWRKMDEFLKLRLGEWTVVTGWSSHGKSQFLDAVAVNVARAAGWKFAIFSPENVPYAQHVRGLVQKVVGKKFRTDIDSADPAMDRDELALALGWLKQHFFFVDIVEPTFETVLKQFWKMVREQDVKAVILDPWNELEPDRAPHQTETEYTGKVLMRFRDFCKMAHVHGFILAHPSKGTLPQANPFAKKKDAGRPVVKLLDISGSSHFENKTFNGLSVWRNPGAETGPERNENHIYILKHRTVGVGGTGKVILHWDPVSTCYFESSDDDQVGTVFVPPNGYLIEELKERFNKLPGGDWRAQARKLRNDWWLATRSLKWKKELEGKSHFKEEYYFEEPLYDLHAGGTSKVTLDAKVLGRVWRDVEGLGTAVWWVSVECPTIELKLLERMPDKAQAFDRAEQTYNFFKDTGGALDPDNYPKGDAAP